MQKRRRLPASARTMYQLQPRRRLGSGSLLCLLRRLDLNAGLRQQRTHGVAGLGAHVQPVAGALDINAKHARLGDRIVDAERLDEAAIARRAALGGDDAVARSFFGTHALESKFDHEIMLPAA